MQEAKFVMLADVSYIFYYELNKLKMFRRLFCHSIYASIYESVHERFVSITRV